MYIYIYSYLGTSESMPGSVTRVKQQKNDVYIAEMKKKTVYSR